MSKLDTGEVYIPRYGETPSDELHDYGKDPCYGDWGRPDEDYYDDDPKSIEDHFQAKKSGAKAGFMREKHFEGDEAYPEGRRRHRTSDATTPR